jgi:hypothetical protein
MAVSMTERSSLFMCANASGDEPHPMRTLASLCPTEVLMNFTSYSPRGKGCPLLALSGRSDDARGYVRCRG